MNANETSTNEELFDAPPESCVRLKRSSVSFPVCPRCHRENGLAKTYIGGNGNEDIVLEPHKSIWDCFKSLWQPTYKNTLPLGLRSQELPGFWKYNSKAFIAIVRKLNFNFLRAIKDKWLVWVVFKLLLLMRFLSKGLSTKRQWHVRKWIPEMISMTWEK